MLTVLTINRERRARESAPFFLIGLLCQPYKSLLNLIYFSSNLFSIIMKTKTILSCLMSISLLFALESCSSNSQTTEQKAQQTAPVSMIRKSVQPWYCCHPGTSFAELEPFVDKLTCINVFGELEPEFINKCHEKGIQVFYSVGGDEKLIDTEQKMKDRVNEYVSHCIAEKYDGLDIDYEHLPDAFRPQYSDFLRLCAKELRAVGKKLSQCVPYTSFMYDDANTPLFCDPQVLNETCDYVRVMCYDLYWAPGIQNPDYQERIDCTGFGPTTTYHWAEKVMQYWTSCIDLDKLVMALPAYGNDYAVTGDQVQGRQVYSLLPDNVKGEMPAPIWLYYEKVNMYVYDATDGQRHIYYACDGASTKKLLELVDRFGIKTIGFWHFSSISTEIWDEVDKWMKQ